MRRGLRPFLTAVVLLSTGSACAGRGGDADAAFIGSVACGSCHAAELRAWEGSQHAVAMQRARTNTALAPFNGERIVANGVTWTFTHSGAMHYVVTTTDAAGRARDFPVRFTFGVWPLQQYLVDYAGGRLQALTMAWDARPARMGGQRWFSLQPAEVVAHGTAQHWTGRSYNWNYMCADCHSTAVRKSYVPAADSFHTTYAEISVSCESCHGPGSLHAEWASAPRWMRGARWKTNGLVNQLTERRDVRWAVAAGARTASRSMPRATDREIETCAQCHARRVHIADGYVAGRPLLDYYIPSLLTSDLYYPDGQQREEVYTYGSFLQSRMYAAGVTCSDCHDPHTEKTRARGNQLCTRCHVAAEYDTTAHHFHKSGGAGASCVGCHMPDTTYMQIDARHDHGLRVPRPDLSVTLGVPNACTRCHTDRDARWAAAAFAKWYPRLRSGGGHQPFALAFAMDDARAPGAADSLRRVAGDSTESPIARGSALARLGAYRDSLAYEAARAGARDPHPLVRLGALQLLESAPNRTRLEVGRTLLRDERRAVRQGAAWVFATLGSSLSLPDSEALAAASAEFIASQRYNADQPDDRLALGAFYAQLGKYDSAATEYRAALRLEPTMTRAAVFLAAVLRAQGRLADAIRALDSARVVAPDDHDLLLSLATYRGEARDTVGALATARELARLYPQDARARTLLRQLTR